MPQLTWYVPIEQWGKRTYFHFQIPDTWQWLVASATQLATLLPTELAIGVCRTPLWRKLAASVTTSLYTKATALANFPTPITAIWTTSISSRTDGQELKPLVITLHYITLLRPPCCCWQHEAAKGLTPLPFGIFWKMEPNPRRAVRRRKKDAALLSSIISKPRHLTVCQCFCFFFCNNFF